MADDREVLRDVWDGKVPVCFSLASEEITSMEQPEYYFLLVPRLSYFPLVMDKVQRSFLNFIDADSEDHSEMWLDADGQPLKWHYPIGVLFDMYGSETSLPWNITVHFQNFPEDELLKCPCREAVEAHFMSMVKEADCLKHRAQVINSMQKKDHMQLWTGLKNDRFDQFWSVNRKLMEHTGDELFKHIPFRIHQGDVQYIQKLFRPTSESGSPHTLGDLLKECVPHVLPSEGAKSKTRVVIHGVQIPFETPIQWLSEHFSHVDNFLHIVLVPE